MNATAPALPELAADLWRLAQATAGGRGFQFSSESASAVQDLILTGVRRLIQDRELENPAKVAETREALTRLIGKMVEVAIEQQRGRILKGTEATSTRMLDENNFFGARNRFCPCYPFC
jgi:hypothetical protein